ncbi:MAG: iron-sulfur cluster assembly scaffold protein [Alphaproteobacteria bacterium]
MAEDLYQTRLIAHAKAAHGKGRIAHPHGSALADNPLCGDRVRVDIRLHLGQIAELKHEVRGCLLCEAAASVMGAHVPGLDASAIADAARALGAFLKGKSEALPANWPELADFAPVRGHRSRHGCVLLPFAAAEQALHKARGG